MSASLLLPGTRELDVGTTNAKGERERVAILSKSPATAKIVYHVSLNLT
jgi:hypothetical protein